MDTGTSSSSTLHYTRIGANVISVDTSITVQSPEACLLFRVSRKHLVLFSASTSDFAAKWRIAQMATIATATAPCINKMHLRNCFQRCVQMGNRRIPRPPLCLNDEFPHSVGRRLIGSSCLIRNAAWLGQTEPLNRTGDFDHEQ